MDSPTGAPDRADTPRPLASSPGALKIGPRQSSEPTQFDFGSMVLAVSTDGKLILIPKGGQEHLTIHFGGRSGILDAHVTVEGEQPTHRPLGGLRLGDAVAILEQAQPTFERNFERLMRASVRRVRFGWLRHHGVFAFPFAHDEEAFLGLGAVQGHRWELDQARFAAAFARPLTRAEVEAAPSPVFLLFRRRGDSSVPYGVLVKVEMCPGQFRYGWFRTDHMIAKLERVWRRYEPLVRDRILPPDRVWPEIVAALEALPRASNEGEPK